MLPCSSRTYARLYPESAPLDMSLILTSIDFSIKCIAAGMSKESVQPEWLTVSSIGGTEYDGMADSMAEVAAAYSIADNGGDSAWQGEE